MIKQVNKPDGATHYAVIDDSTCWYKLTNDGLMKWSGKWRQIESREICGVIFHSIEMISDKQVKATHQAAVAINAELDKLLAIADQLGRELDINIVIDGNQGSFKEGSKAKVSIEYVKR